MSLRIFNNAQLVLCITLYLEPEREGVEPSVALRLRRFSKPVH